MSQIVAKKLARLQADRRIRWGRYRHDDAHFTQKKREKKAEEPGPGLGNNTLDTTIKSNEVPKNQHTSKHFFFRLDREPLSDKPRHPLVGFLRAEIVQLVIDAAATGGAGARAAEGADGGTSGEHESSGEHERGDDRQHAHD